MATDFDFLATVNSAGRADQGHVRRAGYPKSRSPDFDLHLVTRGRGQMQVDGKHFALEQGDLLLVHPGETFFVFAEERELFERIFIHFEVRGPGFTARPIAPRWLRALRLIHGQGRVEWVALIVRILQRFHQKTPASRQLARLHLSELLVHFAAYSPQTPTSEGKPPMDSKVRRNLGVLRRAEQHLREHFREPLSLSRLAAASGLSVNHFTRLFAGYRGQTPYAFCLDLRLEEAKRLILEGGDSLAEVARASGFGSAHHLSVQFRRRLKESPRTYAARFQAPEA